MYFSLHVKYPLFLSDFNDIWILTTGFWKILKYQISLKSVQWKQSRSMRTDRRTGMTKLIVAFRSFANASKNDVISVAKMSKWYFFLRAGVLGMTKNECRILVGNPKRKRPVPKTWRSSENKILFPTAAGYLFSETPRPSVKPTQWVPCVLSPGIQETGALC